ncbi:hypothetical protein WJX74_007489 [Apatococcus lobatus]
MQAVSGANGSAFQHAGSGGHSEAHQVQVGLGQNLPGSITGSAISSRAANSTQEEGGKGCESAQTPGKYSHGKLEELKVSGRERPGDSGESHGFTPRSTATDKRPWKWGSGPETEQNLPGYVQGGRAQLGKDPQGHHGMSPATAEARDRSAKRQCLGHAVGPRWAQSLPAGRGLGHVILEHDCKIASIQDDGECNDGDPVLVRLTNQHEHAADLVIVATGVTPNTDWLPPELERGPSDGGIAVDASMQSSVRGIFAAGDCCWVRPEARGPQWFQMRLWTQARAQGLYAAKCMSGQADPLELGLPFELFTHITRFCGQKVVLLGLYNGQRLDSEPPKEIVTYSRTLGSKGSGSFARVLLLRGRLQGAVLIGETELEETFENLILDGIDLSRYGPDFMDPEIDLQEVFD